MAFNPDEFLASTDSGFNPDKFLAETEEKPGTLEKLNNSLPGVRGALQTGLDVLNSPFELAGESMRTAAEGLAGRSTNFRPPTFLQNMGLANKTEEPPENPFTTANKLLRSGAAFASGLPQGLDNAKDVASQEYSRKPNAIDKTADFALGVGSGLAFPQVANAPMDAAVQGIKNTLGAGKALEGVAGAGALSDDVAKIAPEATSNPGLRSAVKLRGKTYIGEPGDLHVDVIKRIAEQEGIPESQVYDVVNKIGDQGFTKGGEFLTRQEASALAGGTRGEAASLRAAGHLKETPVAPPPPTGPSVEGVTDDVLSHLGNKAKEAVKGPMDEVGDFLSQKYGKVAQRSGWPETVSNYAKEHARNMTLKTLGASPGQIRKIGQANAEALADMALERGIVSPSVGSIGAKQMIEKSAEQAGNVVGNIRKVATQRGAIHDMDQVINEIKSNLDPVYQSPLKSGEKKLYSRALAELQNTDPTADSVSKKVTELFSEAKKQDKLKQPSGAIADVARQLRNINDKLIHQKLSPKEAETYQKALHEYGAMTQMKEFVKRRNSMDAGGRLGPGSGISRMMLQKFLDSVGYRTEARIANKFSDWISKNPQAASSPKAMLGHYADEAVEALDEMGNHE